MAAEHMPHPRASSSRKDGCGLKLPVGGRIAFRVKAGQIQKTGRPVGQIENDVPQPQEAVASGLLILNAAPISSSV
ncbi:MAG: hypothetical protein Tsb0010_05650 [Parvularculaceae bacterium]